MCRASSAAAAPPFGGPCCVVGALCAVVGGGAGCPCALGGGEIVNDSTTDGTGGGVAIAEPAGSAGAVGDAVVEVVLAGIVVVEVVVELVAGTVVVVVVAPIGRRSTVLIVVSWPLQPAVWGATAFTTNPSSTASALPVASLYARAPSASVAASMTNGPTGQSVSLPGADQSCSTAPTMSAWPVRGSTWPRKSVSATVSTTTGVGVGSPRSTERVIGANVMLGAGTESVPLASMSARASLSVRMPSSFCPRVSTERFIATPTLPGFVTAGEAP